MKSLSSSVISEEMFVLIRFITPSVDGLGGPAEPFECRPNAGTGWARPFADLAQQVPLPYQIRGGALPLQGKVHAYKKTIFVSGQFPDGRIDGGGPL